jgi:RNA polymerase sigma-70 factor (ECF subfamily)
MIDATDTSWEQLREQLHGFISRRIDDPATAEDVLQDTLMRMHRGLGALRDDQYLGAWAYRIARNAIVDHHRRRRGHVPLDPEGEASPPEADPDGDNLNQEVARWLRPMIATLPEDYRVALELTELGGLTQAELAEHLGLSLSGAKTRVQRGRRKLRQQIERCCEIERDRLGNVIDYRPRDTCCD